MPYLRTAKRGNIRMETVELKDINQCNRFFSERTLHPLVSVVDLPQSAGRILLRLDFYSILLRESPNCLACCGKKCCDFSEKTLLFLPPGQPLNPATERQAPEKGDKLLCFHPDLIRHTPLESHFGEYTFFHYRQDEALHLSARERDIVEASLNCIAEELDWGIDEYSKKLIALKIDLLLSYCSRFYKRQFITRHEANNEVVEQTDHLLQHYFLTGQAQEKGFPTAERCARIQNLSPAYLNDLLQHETGKDFKEYALFKQFDTACAQLQRTSKSVTEIATELGYHSPQVFCRIFKQLKGCTPTLFRSRYRN